MERSAKNTEQELRVCAFNLENLFVSMEYYGGQNLEDLSEDEWRGCALPQFRSRQKPLAKLWGLAAAIEDIAPDVLMGVEVGGEDSLASFNRHFLKDAYVPFFVEGNARRAIDLGFLVRRDLRLKPEVRSNRDVPVEVATYRGKRLAKFSRDVAELRLHDESDGVRLILLLVHLKSKISTDDDYQGKDARTAEAMALAALYEQRRAEHPGVPIVVGGDFNAELGSLELELVRHTDLTDFHDLRGTPPEDRVSLVHFDAAGGAHAQTIDYLLVSPELRERVFTDRSFTYRYKGPYGIPEPLADTFAVRLRQPSDHYPVVLTFALPDGVR